MSSLANGFSGQWSLSARCRRSSRPRTPRMKTVLFLCTGNYYRSGYAEILFNWKAEECGLKWKADSRGLDPDPLNAGPMSRHTMAALRNLGIPFDQNLRFPLVANEADFQAAHHLVAVKE